MTKYMQYRTSYKPRPVKKPIHPVWRGVGCAMLIIIPIFSYLIANYLIINPTQFAWVYVPREMVISSFKDQYILVKIFYTAILVFILYLIMTVITFAADRFFGPKRYGPLDVPPEEVHRK